MRAKAILSILGTVVVVGVLASNLLGQKAESPAKAKLAVCIKPQHVAEALRAVLASQREVYTRATEGRQVSLSPCEMMRESSEAVASKGVEFAHVLRSLEPLNKRNAPETATEIKALQQLQQDPTSSFYSEELLGGRWYLTAVYPEVATSESCVNCHNTRREAKKHKVGDVLGGMVIRIALEL